MIPMQQGPNLFSPSLISCGLPPREQILDWIEIEWNLDVDLVYSIFKLDPLVIKQIIIYMNYFKILNNLIN